jgi:hypothetical protein
MKRADLHLKYAWDVVVKLYKRRERGFAAHAAIKALACQEEPWTGMLVEGGQIAWYEFEVEGCVIGGSWVSKTS